MVLEIEDTYVADMEAFSAGEFVEYYYVAYDNSQFRNIAIDNNNGDYYQFLVRASPTSPSILFILPTLMGLALVAMIKTNSK